MSLITYREDVDCYVIASKGVVSLDRGRRELDEIEQFYLSKSTRVHPLKILFDIRETVWESREVHDILSREGRMRFAESELRKNHYMAILNSVYTAPTFDNEHWFTDEQDALRWLDEKTAAYKKIVS